MTRRNQCKACPWKLSTVPSRDIPGGYKAELHAKLIACRPEGLGIGQPIRAMACHESTRGAEQMCVGWVVHQLGPGNNIPLRLRASSGEFRDLRTEGEQHETLEAMVASRRKRR